MSEKCSCLLHNILKYSQIFNTNLYFAPKCLSEMEREGTVEQGSGSSSSMFITVCRTEGIFHSSITEARERKRRVVVCKDGAF